MEEVKIGQDGFVRQATVSYKDTSHDDPADWIHRTVERPVRNMVKLFHIEDTSLLEDIQAVFKLSNEILEGERLSFDNQEEAYEETQTRTDDHFDDAVQDHVDDDDF